MKALGNKVVIRPTEKEEETSSGLIVVDASTDKYAEGTVHSAGGKVTEVKEGDRIIYSPLTFDEITADDVVYHVVDEEDVFAVLPK